MIRATDIHSLTDFTRNAKHYIQLVKSSKNPMAITVNGDAEVVIQDAETYQQMVDDLERLRFIGAMRESEKDVAEGRVMDASESFNQVRGALGI